MPPRNDFVQPWDNHAADEHRVFARLQGAYAAMLDHADRNLARLVAFLDQAGLRDDTLILVMSDNGASQEGGPIGMVNAMGPYNGKPEPMEEKIARIDDIGGPDTHSNFPWGWAMASNTPLKRYKQNTHGGGIRDPLVDAWRKGIAARGEMRRLPPRLGPGPHPPGGSALAPPPLAGVAQMPIEGVSFAASLGAADPPRGQPQYFEMFGHRGLWQDGWKAVAYHPPGTPFDNDVGNSTTWTTTSRRPRTSPPSTRTSSPNWSEWWDEAARYKVLPLDDRFAPRFAENATRFHGPRKASSSTPAWAICPPTSPRTCAPAPSSSRPTPV